MNSNSPENVATRVLPAANATFQSKDRPKDTVRKGYGITGSGVNNVSPHLAGRLNIGML